jgi:PAS domain S-box-containing protein
MGGSKDSSKGIKDLKAENAELRLRLDEAEETLRAIRSGEVEALVIGGQIYTLESADAESNRFRGAALAQINDMVVAVDNERHITYINPSAERHYGVKASDVLGLTSDKMVTVRWPDGDKSAEVLATIERDGFWRGENIHVRTDGSEFVVEATVSRLRDADGNPTGRLAVIRDITKRKRAEEELQKAHDELEERVKKRTIELARTNAALIKEMAARSEIEKQRGNLLQRIVTSQEDERRRIARDIHDKLGQRVTALRLQIASLADERADPEKYEGSIELLQRTALRLDSEVSFLAWALRPAALDDLGLPHAARAYIEDWSHNYKISSDFSLRGFDGTRLMPEVETHLYRIMQEALNNIIKHAEATNVSVLLEWNRSGVNLIIEDNGKGFTVSKTGKRRSGNGLGLMGMRERATLIGGEIEIESSPKAGTTLFVRVPVSANGNEKTRERSSGLAASS